MIGLPLCQLRAHLTNLPDPAKICTAFWGAVTCHSAADGRGIYTVK